MQLLLLRDILKAAQANNPRMNVTGYLIFDKRWFLQILEGDSNDVSQIYRKIEVDPRHSELNIILQREVAERQFSNWSMGGAMRDVDTQEIFLRNGISGDIDPSKMTGDQIITLALDLGGSGRG